MWMADKYMRRWSMSLSVGNIQDKFPTRYHYSKSGMAKMKKLTKSSADEKVKQPELSHVVRM